MCSKTATTNCTKEYWDKIEQTRTLLKEAESIVVGVGSGLSAAGGLNYGDVAMAKKWFPEYYAMGYRSLAEIQGKFWCLPNCRPEAYWGYWAKHIYHIRYQTPALQPYKDLLTLVADTNYCIVSTNCDGQLEKAGFPREKIFAPQGEYRYFQCAKPCSDALYDNEQMINTMVNNMPSPLDIHTEDIPTCPKCGGPLVPNLRCDSTFVEKPHLAQLGSYAQFLEDCWGRQTVFLELGVGFNTPGIIRYPFEQYVRNRPKATLVRANSTQATVPRDFESRCIPFEMDVGKLLVDLAV